MLAMDANDYAFFLDKCVALETIASKLAPTGGYALSSLSLSVTDVTALNKNS
ncbi:hypothetical protein [Pseudomonas sp. MPC6]|uniref:hypothetical protein n=1 Tax=unclassified Pseudomonas TaxID=196821 RepID=UPI00137587FE|nr:hypothetical protein [Pseudomonas sp. MPC6]